jgi:flagellar protein FliO/FliZ
MFESLFGAEMPLAVRFFVAFLIVLGLIGAIAWAVRRFGSGRLGTNTRGRQPRLAVIDYASVDGRRRLILVRRDNVEHLLMIGGPSDIVVEPNIVRGVPAARDVGRAPAGIEALTRAIPLPDNGGGSWPLQPDANGGARRPTGGEHPHEELPGRPQPEATTRQRDTLAALADELSTRTPTPPRNRGNAAESQRPEPRSEARQEPRDQRPQPRFEPRKPQQAAAAPAPPATPASTETPAGADQSLADMAQRLEAALRKSPGETRPAAGQPRPAPSGGQPATAESPAPPTPPSPPPRTARGGEQKAAPADGATPNQNKAAVYDTLEQEMANLLGRPGKG